MGEAYTCDTPVSAFRDACVVCVWLEQAIHSALCNIVNDNVNFSHSIFLITKMLPLERNTI